MIKKLFYKDDLQDVVARFIMSDRYGFAGVLLLTASRLLRMVFVVSSLWAAVSHTLDLINDGGFNWVPVFIALAAVALSWLFGYVGERCSQVGCKRVLKRIQKNQITSDTGTQVSYLGKWEKMIKEHRAKVQARKKV